MDLLPARRPGPPVSAGRLLAKVRWILPLVLDVTAAVADGAIRVAVADHGPGVPREEQERIFQSFHRIGADDATVRGYGLGLYFADKLVAAMGGAIRVESPAWPDPAAPGTRFAFTLPIAGDEPPGSDDELEAP